VLFRSQRDVDRGYITAAEAERWYPLASAAE
jgi:hypothetical protein